MQSGAVVVTGVSRHSLGEAVVQRYLARYPGKKLIVISKNTNGDIAAIQGVTPVQFDLNPLNHSAGFYGFSKALQEKIELALQSTCSSGVEQLIHSAGVYDFGALSESDVVDRGELLGLNALGMVEVLSAIMRLNLRQGFCNETGLTFTLVGAFQGLQVRALRALYASSKAMGIDFCASLAAGREVARCVYVAPGPMDTPMLHRNHWVKKAKGSSRFFEAALGASRGEYESVFFECRTEAIAAIAMKHFCDQLQELEATMTRYRQFRAEARENELGILAVSDCATALVDDILSTDCGSGVFLIANGHNARALIMRAKFEDLDRYKLFQTAARSLV